MNDLIENIFKIIPQCVYCTTNYVCNDQKLQQHDLKLQDDDDLF